MARTNPATVAAHQRAWSLFQASQLISAEKLYQEIREQDHLDVGAWLMLGIIHGQLGKYDEAEAYLNTALTLDPRNYDIHLNRGLVLYHKGQTEQSLVCFQEALTLCPDHSSALLHAGNAYANLDRLSEAAVCYSRAQGNDAATITCKGNLANILAYQGKTEKAVETFRAALALNPNQPAVFSNLLLSLHYNTHYGPEEIYREHLTWASRFAEKLPARTRYDNDPKPDRKLRIGYVTPDLRVHSVAYFLEPILTHHNRDRFGVFCYTDLDSRDNTTERLLQKAGTVRNITGLPHSTVADLVSTDQIDILVDLAGHTRGNRLLAFAHKPAPVQMTYLGYPNTTGMETIDYRITDARADPPGTTEHLHTEKLLRLKNSFLCYLPPGESPAITPTPAIKNGYVTFGSFNAFTKISKVMLIAWSRILSDVQKSRIIIKNKQLTDKTLRHNVTDILGANGISPDRIELVGRTSKEEHMACYGKVDIALDSYPYNGTTTTCDALWMGVPVITLAGGSHVSRVGVSLLTAVQLESLIARDIDSYISLATTLAGDLAKLGHLRRRLRDTMQRSNLCDGETFTRELEAQYRDVWKDWCRKHQD